MNHMTLATFYSGTVLYVVGAVFALRHLKRTDDYFMDVANRFMLCGAALLVATFLIRAATWQRVPLTTVCDSLNLFVLLSTFVVVIVSRAERMRPLLSVYLPPIALIAVINALAGYRYLFEEPRELRGLFLTVHVGLAFLAYALFFVASLTSMGYIVQARRLKRRHTTGVFQQLPSLERLDKVLFRLVSVGYPMFVITLILGAYWAHLDPEELSERWWLAPKILMAVIMASFYSITFHSRRLGWLRGPKLAYFVFIGFTSLLALYLALGLTQLNNYNFWGVHS